jgi:hypothetical protein
MLGAITQDVTHSARSSGLVVVVEHVLCKRKSMSNLQLTEYQSNTNLGLEESLGNGLQIELANVAANDTVHAAHAISEGCDEGKRLAVHHTECVALRLVLE